MQEADTFKAEAVELAERQVELIYSERMHEFAALQAKAMAMQGQLQIAYQETAAGRQSCVNILFCFFLICFVLFCLAFSMVLHASLSIG